MADQPLLEERTLALIRAELDGELDAGDRAELEQRLAADPEARRVRADLARVVDGLARLTPLAPPTSLRTDVLAATRSRPRPSAPRAQRSPWPRQVLAMAAGLVLGVFGALAWLPTRQDFDPGALAGTMGQQASEHAGTAAGGWTLATPDVSGQVELRREGEVWLLVFDLDSRLPVAVTATYGDALLRLQGHAQGDSGATTLQSLPGRVAFESVGAQRLALFLAPATATEAAAAARVTVRIEAQGRVVREGELAASPVTSKP